MSGIRGDAPAGATGYLAPEGFLPELLAELEEPGEVYDRLVVAPGPPRAAAWVENLWYEPFRIPIRSIGDGVRALRSLKRDWLLYSTALHRRAHLIEEQLPRVEVAPLEFPCALPPSRLGAWTLLDANTILAARDTSSPFPNGRVALVENRLDPPNRAYLKLWEAWARLDAWPEPSELCLDLGSSPGGWTWAIAKLGARVISIDRAPLDPRVAALPGVEHQSRSAFSVEPAEIGPVGWLCSDVVCYPERLLRLVENWIASGLARNLLCTIKYQGATDHETTRAFAAIPGSQLLHLHQNRHELTWVRLGTGGRRRTVANGPP